VKRRRSRHPRLAGFESWMAHADHLAGDLAYVAGCSVCELKIHSGISLPNEGARRSLKFYNEAQESKRKAIPLDEAP
jgi:hypothetical protein